MNDDVPTDDEMLLSTETIQSILSRLNALETQADMSACNHNCRIHEDWVFNGEDEVRVFTCDNCGEEV
jgi:hypothetical protein